MIYGNIAKNCGFGNISDKEILEALIDISSMDKEISESMIDQLLTEMSDEYGYLTEAGGKELLKKMLDMGKKVVQKSVETTAKMVNDATGKMKENMTDDKSIYDKYKDKFMENARKNGVKTRYKNAFTLTGDWDLNHIINSGSNLAKTGDFEASLFKMGSTWIKDDTSDAAKARYKEKMDREVADRKANIDKTCNEMKEKYDKFFEKSDEEETLDAFIVADNVINAMMNGQENIKDLKDVNKKNEDVMNKNLKAAEDKYNSVKEDEASFEAMGYKAWYDILSHLCKRVIEADRMAVSGMERYYHEARRAFLATAGLAHRPEEQKESALIESAEVDEICEYICDRW